MNVRKLLIEPIGYIRPAHAVDGLAAEDAERRLDSAPHSVAEVVAHLAFWQEWFVDRCTGTFVPMIASAAAGWPAVAPGSWPALRDRFVAGLERAASLGEPADRLRQPIAPAIEFPPLARYTIGDALVHMATHNSHHLGQIIVLRQMMRRWPPPAGSYTW